jgi:hypothetical protein
VRQRGRKSGATIAPLRVNGSAPPIQAPAGLSRAERTAFDKLAAATGHLIESDVSLVVSYVQAGLVARRLAGELAQNLALFRPWKEAVKLQTTLAVKLRLAPSTRCDPKTLGRRSPPPGKPIWET